MRTQLVSIDTPTLPLDGAFHEPESGPVRGGVLLFHGNTMNFYTGALRFLPPVLTSMGYACLAFNRRGHDILSIRNSRAAEGAAFQTTAEGIEDNALAARWMAERGFPAPVVIGHSNGGMLAVKHVHDRPETPALILLSAHRGGAGDTVLQSLSMSGHLAQARSAEVLAEARALVAEGRGDTLMLVPGWWYVISAASYVDRLTTMHAILDLAPEIKVPTLYIRGDDESPVGYPAEIYAERAGGPCEAQVLPGCDHFYNGVEDLVCARVADWLRRTLGADA
ncbi:alpha/beta hydrolase [Aquabacter spiritensis]|uniref:Alpha-beta hydrolase superfamily lysophospholipase n=1 Tax=Aquabacter spiritensis TaxID=933073 RepID=A0A4R3M0T7_9HYPH|nr:alpha/beta hydrolase [Aquabacter spiritensis]TCT06694.1 alpha-beta hydrolase superfamily lysophospholipase [Aquabacter spiritensis]